MTTGATLNGRALARNGAVSLDSNTITKAACVSQTSTPTSSNTSATTSPGQPVTVVLTGTGTAPILFTIMRGPTHGTLGAINPLTGTVTYTPAPGYIGSDSFTYADGTSTTRTVTITITPTVRGGPTPTTPGAGGATSTAVPQLSGPRDCVDGPFRVRVTGRRIARVAFSVDGKRRQTVKAKAGRTVFSVRVNPFQQHYRVHRVTARVRFTAASGMKARTLRLVYQRCAKVTPKLRFAG